MIEGHALVVSFLGFDRRELLVLANALSFDRSDDRSNLARLLRAVASRFRLGGEIQIELANFT